ncbi:DUF7674 family protein [Chitinophaga sp. NPDC101104]|uniref:DUF7674 family protein n=1 Tax=Chitinophaga sp. NPDC101104 TaxID=3390561 RepID=UPI003D01527A
MSTWRRKAIEYIPQCRREFQAPDADIYTILIEMRAVVVQAHRDNDIPLLTKCYAYAEWCHRQKANELYNAICVCFYEHLIDQPETMKDMTTWVKKDIYLDIRSLLEYRSNTDEEMAALDDAYGIPLQERPKSWRKEKFKFR